MDCIYNDKFRLYFLHVDKMPLVPLLVANVRHFSLLVATDAPSVHNLFAFTMEK